LYCIGSNASITTKGEVDIDDEGFTRVNSRLPVRAAYSFYIVAGDLRQYLISYVCNEYSTYGSHDVGSKLKLFETSNEFLWSTFILQFTHMFGQDRWNLQIQYWSKQKLLSNFTTYPCQHYCDSIQITAPIS
jgi:hypothetical protein